VAEKIEVVKVDELGRIKLPKHIREELRIKEKNIFEIFTCDGEIILVPIKETIYEPTKKGWGN